MPRLWADASFYQYQSRSIRGGMALQSRKFPGVLDDCVPNSLEAHSALAMARKSSSDGRAARNCFCRGYGNLFDLAVDGQACRRRHYLTGLAESRIGQFASNSKSTLAGQDLKSIRKSMDCPNPNLADPRFNGQKAHRTHGNPTV